MCRDAFVADRHVKDMKEKAVVVRLSKPKSYGIPF